MIHPDTELRLVSQDIGCGVFATAFIPQGTIVYVKDQLEIELTPRAYAALDEGHRAVADRYSYRDERGVRIVSWDIAKYVNHCCECNTMSTGYGYEMALRDIVAGEELTDEYGLFNPTEPMPLYCGCRNCREVLRPDDIDRLHPQWDRQVQRALLRLPKVAQPLWWLLDEATREATLGYLGGVQPYRSVLALRYVPPSRRQRPLRPTSGAPRRRRRLQPAA